VTSAARWRFLFLEALRFSRELVQPSQRAASFSDELFTTQPPVRHFEARVRREGGTSFPRGTPRFRLQSPSWGGARQERAPVLEHFLNASFGTRIGPKLEGRS